MAIPANRLPTTAHVALDGHLTSTTHPALPRAASTLRAAVRTTLKEHKRLPLSARTAHLHHVLVSIKEYLPYLLTLDAGLSGQQVANEEVDIVLATEPELRWRVMLQATTPGREAPRVKLQHFDYEIPFALSTLASTHYLLGRAQLHTLYSTTTPSADRRATAVSTAMQHFLAANSFYTFLVERAVSSSPAVPAVDINPAVLEALGGLCLAEATLAAVLKDDPYPATVTQERNVHDKEWMYVPPSLPKVRAHLFARLCVTAADHAARAAAALAGVTKLDEALPHYLEGLRRAARAKACRFLSINADLTGDQGDCVAWLQSARAELGLLAPPPASEDRSAKGAFSRFRRERAERKEDKKVERGVDWGSDAGRFEESRVVDMLLAKAVRTNDAVYHHVVPAHGTMVAKLPSGREYHTVQPFVPQLLDSVTLARMRAPPEPVGSSQRPPDLYDESSDEG